MSGPDSLKRVVADVVASCKCERLVAWRELVAREKRASFRDEAYWGKPVPPMGDPNARLLIVGLAPAAHGGNRTGRIFTGDRSGDWLFASMLLGKGLRLSFLVTCRKMRWEVMQSPPIRLPWKSWFNAKF